MIVTSLRVGSPTVREGIVGNVALTHGRASDTNGCLF
jgi:hypothetical protein